MTRRVLVASLGATLRGDDGFGPRLLARLARRLPATVETRDFGTHGLSLVQALFDRVDVLLLLDACRRGGRPGTLYLLRPEPADAVEPSAHLTGPRQVLGLARELGVLPREVWLLGCEPASADAYTLRLSRPVRRALRRATELAVGLIHRIDP